MFGDRGGQASGPAVLNPDSRWQPYPNVTGTNHQQYGTLCFYPSDKTSITFFLTTYRF
jgi:hypothetical protein